ncbi:hypothetical protein TNCV_4274261 [Trichonephila clavipes]|nr:hypothetical protein TNCV_4274261 [Trichonephila clavipes]
MMTSDSPIDMDLAHSASLPSSRASTPTLTNCERLQIADSDLRKFSILHNNVSHTIRAIVFYSQDDDPELAGLYILQDYLYEKQQAAVSEFNTLPHCDTPGCQIHSHSLQDIDFPELHKINRPKRKESEEGFPSPTSRHTVKKKNPLWNLKTLI